MTALRYARTPSTGLINTLTGGLLAPLLKPWTVSGLLLDLQLRENDEVMLYCGLTRLVVAKYRPPMVEITADDAYVKQSCASALMKPWGLQAPGFENALRTYLQAVQVNSRYTGKEGAVQTAWNQVAEPWTPIDREAVIGGGLKPIPQVAKATQAVQVIASGWARVSDPKAANELDILAVDCAGALVLVEIKYGRASTLYYAPLQALRYAWEWSQVVKTLLPEVQDLITAKQQLGLLPSNLPPLTGALRVAVAWGDEPPSPEVVGRTTRVRDALKPHLPPGVPDIELWAINNGHPCPV